MEIFWCNYCKIGCEPKFWVKDVVIDTDFPFCSNRCLCVWAEEKEKE